MRHGTKEFTVDKFLGVNEAADGFTEVAMGEASRMENFFITDGCNLTVRPGIKRVDQGQTRTPGQILAAWSGHIGADSGFPEEEYFVVVDFLNGADRFWMYGQDEHGAWTVVYSQEGALGLTAVEEAVVKIFAFGEKLYVMSTAKTAILENGALTEAQPYIPLVIAGADPNGGGTEIEGINRLSPYRRINYSPDGTVTAFTLPAEAVSVEQVIVDNVSFTPGEKGSWDAESQTFTFTEAPKKGVGNVEFVYGTDAEAAEESRQQVLRMRLIEAYNGSTDTRLFAAGDGTNLCLYTGVTEIGEASPLYWPAMNEVRVDMTGAAVTGLVRHYSKLLVFVKGEGAYTISYEPVSLPDGTTTAGFYLRTMNREFGNDVLGQVQTVNNYPRTITKNGIFEWRITSSYYKDERYANRVSDKVERSLKAADISRVVTCDDNYNKTYYVFLNDMEGTVLVNRYDLGEEGIWCIYKSGLCTDVKYAVMSRGQLIFTSGTETFCFDESLSMDAAAEFGGKPTGIPCLWESGFMDFGVDYQRKYSSQIYVSMLPETNSEMIITAATDRRSEYMEKTVNTNIFSFDNFTFTGLTFDTNDTPKIQRVRLKVKKFVYYKLIFRVRTPGVQATVLGYDQVVRYSSMAK